MNDAWKPSGSPENWRRRGQLLAAVRRFFHERGVLEVETPLLCHGIGTDPQLDFFSTEYRFSPVVEKLYLQTSPEFAMKRLLAAGSGAIYQICKAFRNGESGRFHNPEFTLLEWYRPGFDLFELMTEIEQLFQVLFAESEPPLQDPLITSYQAVFERYTGLNPLVFARAEYADYAVRNGFPEAVGLCADSHEWWLDFIFSHCVQPNLGRQGLCMVYGYPACQASLARLNADNPAVADRVEIFIRGIELGNGFYELTDVVEQERRFDAEIACRQQQGLEMVATDRRFLDALTAGLPACSGMAIGLDRILMLLAGAEAIDEVLAFPVSRA